MGFKMRKPRTYGGFYNRSENPKKCIESVAEGGRSVMSYQCSRDRGFGKDGLYCKQHAKEYPATEEVVIWYEIDYTDRVKPIRVTGETEKCLYVQWGQSGRSSRQAKTGKEFRTEREAYEALLVRQQDNLESKQRDIAEIEADILETKRWLSNA